MSGAAEITSDRVDVLVKYITTGTYPCNFTNIEKKGVRQQAKQFTVIHNSLFYVHKNKASGIVTHRQVVYDLVEKKRIIEAHHDGVDGGHLGRDKTYAKVSQCSVTGTGSLIHVYI